jgi:hypothetical protein
LRWRRELKPVNFLLLAGIALLLAAIVHIWWGGGEGPALRSASDHKSQPPAAPILRDNQPITAFAVVSAKDLFSQDRTGPGLEPAKSQSSLEGCELLGTMIIGDSKAAIIGGRLKEDAKSAKEVETVYLGEECQGLKIVDISDGSVTFSGRDGAKTLKFPE